MLSEGQNSSRATNLSSNEKVMVFAEFNYSSDGAKAFNIEANSQNYSQKYSESFDTEGVSIENYGRINKNYTTNILMFNVVNNWYTGLVTWNISDPLLSNKTTLNNNETILVIIENNYTQGN